MNDSLQKLVIASNNKGKIKEISAILGDAFTYVSLEDVGFCDEIEENGSSFLENALIKAKAVYDTTGMYSLSDDSGLCVDELAGAPGIYSARYAGENVCDGDNNKLLLENMKEIENRSAKFVSCVVLYFGDNNYIYGMGETHGEIMKKAVGKNGFGYDSLFFSHELNKSFGVATNEEKNSVSHRAKALKDLLKNLDKMLD